MFESYDGIRRGYEKFIDELTLPDLDSGKSGVNFDLDSGV